VTFSVDGIAAFLLLPLAVWILISGIDDLIIDGAGLLAWLRSRRQKQPGRRELLRIAQRRIAIFVPCWQESPVLERMISGNRERVNYDNYDFFVGAYPNDVDTIRVARDLEMRFNNVHLALCPHPGPTSKADCLNWIYQRMCLFERSRLVAFDVIVTHDAEDVIHTDSLRWINFYSGDYDMIQIPVLPLPTPVSDWTHGVYCDEFSEYQCRDMPARQWMGAFVPSNGVGTGYVRAALESLAADEGNRIFEPVCLTEDYENGLRLRLRSARQIFVTVRGDEVSTREFFPRTFRSAVKQRTRWVTGIALQTWERHGWTGSWADRYWLWRDRKGLVGNPASLLANVLFLYGLMVRGGAFGQRLGELGPLLACTAAVGLYRVGFRAYCVGRRYGWRIGAAVPPRVVLANCINTLATVRAMAIYARARVLSQPLRWVKTAHQYPCISALQPPRRMLGDLLVANGYATAQQVSEALETRAEGQRLGERLIEMGYLGQEDLYEVLSLQSQLPFSAVHPREVSQRVARSLPKRVIRELQVLPFRVEDGKLLLATPGIPPGSTASAVKRFTRLDVRFHLVLPDQYQRLVRELL